MRVSRAVKALRARELSTSYCDKDEAWAQTRRRGHAMCRRRLAEVAKRRQPCRAVAEDGGHVMSMGMGGRTKGAMRFDGIRRTRRVGGTG